MFKVLVSILIISSIFTQNELPEEQENKMFGKFQKFMEKYNKQYESNEEFLNRYNIFKTNYYTAKNQTQDNSEYILGTTEFMDLTSEEFQAKFLNLQVDTDVPADTQMYLPEKDDEIHDESNNSTETNNDSGFLEKPAGNGRRVLQSVPSSWDWRSQGAVTSVKQQGNCGGCWAFATAANIEGLYFRKTGKLVSFSPQQMIDCDSGNYGCNGGVLANAYKYIKSAGGLVSLSSYPFLGYRGVCKRVSTSALATVSGYTMSGSTNEESIKQMLYKYGPLAITINMTPLQYYKSGVFNPSSCAYAPNHGVTIVGYGTT